MGNWSRIASFRDVDYDFDDDDNEISDRLKKAYHEGMKDGIKYAKKAVKTGFRTAERHRTHDDYDLDF